MDLGFWFLVVVVGDFLIEGKKKGKEKVIAIMRTSWADSVANSASENATTNSSDTNGLKRPTRSTYVPPHLRNKQPSADALPPPHAHAAPSPVNDRAGFGFVGPATGSRWGGDSRPDFGGRGGYVGRGGNGWNGRSGGWDRREVNPFREDENAEEAFGEQENSGINFDAYEDIPVETSGDNVPPPVNTFAGIDLGDALNENIRRCKYVKPTPVQRYAIPISLAGRDLMACAQTGSGKTAAFCFPIISGIMRGHGVQRPRGARTVYPLALILSPTRELSCQVGSPISTTLCVFSLLAAFCFIVGGCLFFLISVSFVIYS